MKLEVELKAYAAKLEPLQNIMAALGADFIGKQYEIDTYFSHPDRDFGKTDEALRLRDIEDLEIAEEEKDDKIDKHKHYELSYKGPKIDPTSKTRKEYTVKIDSKNDAEQILYQLGFKNVIEVRKTRYIYNYKNYTICLDDVDDLGHFVEFEKILDDDVEFEKTISDMRLLLERELNLHKFERRSYMELIMEQHNSKTN